MAVTILECLRNAEYNLTENKNNVLAHAIGSEQLHNAIGLLEKGYPLYFEVETALEGYEKIEDVPEYKILFQTNNIDK